MPPRSTRRNIGSAWGNNLPLPPLASTLNISHSASAGRKHAQPEHLKSYWETESMQGEQLLASYWESVTWDTLRGIEPLKRKRLCDILQEKAVLMEDTIGKPILEVLKRPLHGNTASVNATRNVNIEDLATVSRAMTDIMPLYTHHKSKYGRG